MCAGLRTDRGRGALNALWALHQSAGIDEATALTALNHAYPPVRSWAARLLGDDRGVQRNLGAGRHASAKGQEEPGALPAPLFAALLAQARTMVVSRTGALTSARVIKTL